MPRRASSCPGPDSGASRGADAGGAGPETRAALLRGLAPLLDLAFGTEGEAAFPEEIAALVDRLHAGPLGPDSARHPERARRRVEASA